MTKTLTVLDPSKPQLIHFKYSYTATMKVTDGLVKQIKGVLNAELTSEPSLAIVLARIAETLHADGALAGARSLTIRVSIKKRPLK